MRLKIELVPMSAWGKSLFHYLHENKKSHSWRKLKKELFEKEGQYCWICGRKNIQLDAHEFWHYSEKKGVQLLKEIHHICTDCHSIKHLKRSLSVGISLESLEKHFCNINSCSRVDFEKHIKKEFKKWERRNKIHWKQDFGKYSHLVKETQKTFGKHTYVIRPGIKNLNFSRWKKNIFLKKNTSRKIKTKTTN